MTKPTRVTREDIRTLETIYADGRALGHVINELNTDLARVIQENTALLTEVRTLRHRLHLQDIQTRLAIPRPQPLNGPGLPGTFEKRGTKRNTPGLHTAAH